MIKLITINHNRRPLYVGLIIVAVAIAGLLTGNYVLVRAYQNKILPNLFLGDLYLGGKSIAESNKLIQADCQKLNTGRLTLILADTSATFSLKELGVSFNCPATMQAVKQFGHSGNFIADLINRGKAMVSDIHIPAVYQRASALDKTITQLAKRIDREPVAATLNIVGQKVVVKDSLIGQKLDAVKLNLIINRRLADLDLKPIQVPITSSLPLFSTELAAITSAKISSSLTLPYQLKARDKNFSLAANNLWDWLEIITTDDQFIVRLKEDKLTEYFKQLALSIDQPMQNALLVIDKTKVTDFRSHKLGTVLRVKDAVSLIQTNLLTANRELDLPVNYLEPQVKLSELNNLGINELVAEGISNFSGSPKNRQHNIRTGVSRFNYLLIPPQTTFSFGLALGEVSAATGYLPEMVIKGDATIPEYGGGLCQVSTTAFRAILNGGYPVVERKAHAYRVGYYEPAGSDATIYPPSPDLKFTNDSSGYILINAYIVNTYVHFDFYGTKLNRRVEFKGPEIYNITDYPDPIYIETSTIPVGEVKQIDRAHKGADATLYRYIYDEQGKLINKDVFKSHYVPWPAKYLVGVKEAPAIETNLKGTMPEPSAPNQPEI